MKFSPLVAMSALALAVIAGSVGWAEATHAKPHAAAKQADSESAEAAEPAEAAGPGFTICAKGKFPAYVVVTATKAKSPVAQPGKCVKASVDDESASYPIKIFGLEGTTPFEIGDDEVGGDGSEKVDVTGTAENPDWTTE
jgi:hypothetical protein